MSDTNRADDQATGDRDIDRDELEIKSDWFTFDAETGDEKVDVKVNMHIDYDLEIFPRGGDYTHTINVNGIPVHAIYNDRDNAQRWIYEVLDDEDDPCDSLLDAGLRLGAFKVEYNRKVALGGGDWNRGDNLDKFEKNKRAQLDALIQKIKEV